MISFYNFDFRGEGRSLPSYAKALTETAAFAKGTGKRFEIDDKTQIKLGKIDSIKIKSRTVDVVLTKNKERKINITYKGYILWRNNGKPGQEVTKIHKTLTGKKLKIDVETEDSDNDDYDNRSKLTVNLPESFKGELEVKAVSADINVDSFDLKEFDIKLVSGDIDLDKFNADEFGIRTVSGDISIASVKSKEIDINTVSGDLKAGSLISKEVDIKTVSGDTKIESLTGELEYKSTSGDLDINIEKMDGDIEIKLTSGDVALTLPPKSEFKMDLSSFSGKIRSDFPFNTVDEKPMHVKGNIGKGKYTIEVESMSGDIKLKKSRS